MKRKYCFWIFLFLFIPIALASCESSSNQSRDHLPDEPSRNNNKPSTPTQIPDVDKDGIADNVESRLIEKFKPVLFFDENEPVDVVNETLTLYQVHPARKGNQQGYLITITMLYPIDYGMEDFDLDGWDHLTCGPIIGDVFAYLGSQLDTDGHCGDSEALRIFVADYGNTWKLESIVIKRHHDDWKDYDESRFSYESDKETGLKTHPVIYVSESKHAMYSSINECEDYSVELYNVGFSCEVKFEDCGGGIKLSLYTPPSYNVGEHNKHNFNALNEVTTLFPGEDAWKDTPFCGGYTWESCKDFAGMFDKTCAGSIGGKWFP